MKAGDKPDDYVGVNGGAKAYDGVSSRRLNIIMLEVAIRALPWQLRRCVYYRWIGKRPLGVTLRLVGLSKSVYYRRCGLAVDFIHKYVNGQVIDYAVLCKKISCD